MGVSIKLSTSAANATILEKTVVLKLSEKAHITNNAKQDSIFNRLRRRRLTKGRSLVSVGAYLNTNIKAIANIVILK